MSSDATGVFAAQAPGAMRALMAAFGTLSVEDAAAILGNAGHESLGLTKLQEMRPTVAGSRGGWGWFQWTGPRRRAFEAFARERLLAPDSYAANLGFLIEELRGPEAGALVAVKAAKGLDAKVVAFEEAFERAGVKAYASRQLWARRALAAYKQGAHPAPLPQVSTAPVAASPPPPDVEADDAPPAVKPLTQSQTFLAQLGTIASGVIAPLAAAFAGIDWRAILALSAAGTLAFTLWMIARHLQRRARGVA